jgi:hypothetical protein
LPLEREDLRGEAATFAAAPSIFDRETLADFVDPPVERVEARMNGAVVKVKHISRREKSEDPVVRFYVDEHLLDPVAHGNNTVPQDVHRTLPPKKVMFWYG